MDRSTRRESGEGDLAARPEMLVVHELTLHLEEAQETLAAIRRGEIDAVVVASGSDRLVMVLKEADPDPVHRAPFEAMNEGALTVARDTTVLRANARFVEMIGQPLAEIAGAQLGRFVAPGGAEAVARLLGEAAGGPSRGKIALRGANGRHIPALMSTSCVGEGEERSYIVVLTDLGPLEDAQRALELANEALEAKVTARTDDLSRANDALRAEIERRRLLEEQLRLQAEALAEDDRRKDELLSMLAHELRNPLAPIVTAAELLRSAGTESPRVERYRAIIERQARHLSRLVDDLLDASRLTRRTIVLQRQPVDLRAAVESAVEAARPLIDARAHALSVAASADLPRMLLDATRFEQILVNLLNNAANYTERGGHITLSVERGEAEVSIRVRDSGIGIGPDLLPRVFDLFVQGERSLDRSMGGLGIGLTMVKSLVELHGGTVKVSSEGAGQGSEFVVRLPIEAAAEASREDAAKIEGEEGTQARSRRRVLVVEDNVDAAQTLRDLVASWGYEVFHAGDGEHGVRLADELRPSVMLVDIGLPGMSGYEVARQVRAQITRAGREGLVLIGITGYGQDQDRTLSQDAGIDHHLVKPLDPALLKQLLARSLPRAR